MWQIGNGCSIMDIKAKQFDQGVDKKIEPGVKVEKALRI